MLVGVDTLTFPVTLLFLNSWKQIRYLTQVKYEENFLKIIRQMHNVLQMTYFIREWWNRDSKISITRWDFSIRDVAPGPLMT